MNRTYNLVTVQLRGDIVGGIDNALMALPPESRADAQVINVAFEANHLGSRLSEIIIKYKVPEYDSTSIMTSGDVVLNRAPDQEPSDHESGEPEPDTTDMRLGPPLPMGS